MTASTHSAGYDAIVAWSRRIHGEMQRGRPVDRHEWAVTCARLLDEHGTAAALPRFPSPFLSTRMGRDETVRRLWLRANQEAALVHPPADTKPWIAGTLLVLVLLVLPGLVHLIGGR